jgi:hypothetical protein
MELRERGTAFVPQSHSWCATPRRVGVGESFANKLLKHQERSSSPAPVRQGWPLGHLQARALPGIPDQSG